MNRYAVYFAPEPDSDLYRFGSAWLGRDARNGATTKATDVNGITAERIGEITAAPRRYGFHATLKPPFALAAGHTADELQRALQAFARDCTPFDMPPLRLAEIDGFLALVPRSPSTELTALAERAVRACDTFRAPPSAAERERRAHAALDARERELLAAWGYPYVLDRWRFHMTLTERLDSLERERVKTALEPIFAQFCREPLHVDAIALFVQPGRDEPFHYRARFAFGRAA